MFLWLHKQYQFRKQSVTNKPKWVLTVDGTESLSLFGADAQCHVVEAASWKELWARQQIYSLSPLLNIHFLRKEHESIKLCYISAHVVLLTKFSSSSVRFIHINKISKLLLFNWFGRGIYRGLPISKSASFQEGRVDCECGWLCLMLLLCLFSDVVSLDWLSVLVCLAFLILLSDRNWIRAVDPEADDETGGDLRVLILAMETGFLAWDLGAVGWLLLEERGARFGGACCGCCAVADIFAFSFVACLAMTRTPHTMHTTTHEGWRGLIFFFFFVLFWR